jgi:hypothetical protein
MYDLSSEGNVAGKIAYFLPTIDTAATDGFGSATIQSTSTNISNRHNSMKAAYGTYQPKQ